MHSKWNTWPQGSTEVFSLPLNKGSMQTEHWFWSYTFCWRFFSSSSNLRNSYFAKFASSFNYFSLRSLRSLASLFSSARRSFLICSYRCSSSNFFFLKESSSRFFFYSKSFLCFSSSYFFLTSNNLINLLCSSFALFSSKALYSFKALSSPYFSLI